ncbi:MAG: hypothetical protein AB8I08_12950 [Sandaracinaceae bacterium]
MAALGRKMAETETTLTTAQERAEELEGERDALTEELELARSETEEVKAKLAEREAEVQALETIRSEQSTQITSLEEQSHGLGSELASLRGKVSGDDEILERARRALSIGLSLLEDQKNGAASSE